MAIQPRRPERDVAGRGAHGQVVRIFAVLGMAFALSISTLALVQPAGALGAKVLADPGLQTLRIWPGRPMLHVIEQPQEAAPGYLNLIIEYKYEAGCTLADRLPGTGIVLLKDMPALSMASVRIRSDAFTALREQDFVERIVRAAVTP